MSALEDSDDDDTTPSLADTTGRTSYMHNSTIMSDETARMLGRRMSDAMLSSPVEIRNRSSEKGADQQDTSEDDRPPGPEHHPPTYLVSPAELAAQLLANPKLAGLRSPMVMTPLQSLSKTTSPISPPILMNPKCSGYFVEPVCDRFVHCGSVTDIFLT
jgi:dual specificity phosphatase 12